MLYQILITVGASQALNMAILTLLKKQRTQADYLLSMELGLLFGITMLFNYKFELFQYSPYFIFMPFLLAYLAVPVFYLYTKSMTRGSLDLSAPTYWVHLLPLLAAAAVLLLYFAPLPLEDQVELVLLIREESIAPLWFYLISYGLFLGAFPFYLYRSFRLLREHEHFLLTRFSYTEDISLNWLVRFVYAMGGVWLGFLSFEIVGHGILGVLPTQLAYQLAFIFLIVNIFLLGLYGLRARVGFMDSPRVQHQPELGEDGPVKYAHSSLTDEKADVYLQQLQAYMSKEKPYLEPRISIGELSERTGIPANDLSRIINQQLGMHFFDFINSYRVEEFKRLAADPDNQHLTLLSLAHDAGFNSKSTFNAIFKKFTGQTPSEFTSQLTPQTS